MFSHDDVFKSIRLLNLEGNELDDWNEIRKLSNLKRYFNVQDTNHC